MFTFHGWSYFLKNQLELGVSIMESVGLDVRKKKEKRKKKKEKPEEGANELSCIFKEKIIYVRINES